MRLDVAPLLTVVVLALPSVGAAVELVDADLQSVSAFITSGGDCTGTIDLHRDQGTVTVDLGCKLVTITIDGGEVTIHSDPPGGGVLLTALVAMPESSVPVLPLTLRASPPSLDLGFWTTPVGAIGGYYPGLEGVGITPSATIQVLSGETLSLPLAHSLLQQLSIEFFTAFPQEGSGSDVTRAEFEALVEAAGALVEEVASLATRITRIEQLPGIKQKLGCGLGSELALVLPPLLWMRQRRRARG